MSGSKFLLDTNIILGYKESSGSNTLELSLYQFSRIMTKFGDRVRFFFAESIFVHLPYNKHRSSGVDDNALCAFGDKIINAFGFPEFPANFDPA